MHFASNRKEYKTRLCFIGLTPSDAGQFLTQIEKWETHSGLEWTVSRLKSLKVLYLQLQSGNRSYNDPYIYQKENGYPKGIMGVLMTRYPLKVVIDSLHIYSSVINKGKPTTQQLNKFFQSMEKDPGSVPREGIEYVSDLLRYSPVLRLVRGIAAGTCSRVGVVLSDEANSDHGRARNGFQEVIERSHDITAWAQSHTRRAPTLLDFERVKSLSEQELDFYNEVYFYSKNSAPYFGELFDMDPELYYSITRSSKIRDIISEHLTNPHYRRVKGSIPTDFVGKISFIQEGGMKLRAVANPVRTAQALAYPAGYALWDVIKFIEKKFSGELRFNSLVYDQQRADPFLVNDSRPSARLGGYKFSIDLSDATNHFPWEIQTFVMKEIGIPESWILAADKVAKGSWLCPDGKYRKFTVGQPLGAFFSFASFHLTHFLLVAAICCRKWEVSYTEILDGKRLLPFHMVGDDVVILDEEVAKEYLYILRLLNIPHSPQKSLTSKHTIEFVSKVYHNGHRYDVPKWKDVNVHNALSIYEADPSKIQHLPPYFVKVIEEYAALPEPLGLGRNPKGLTLDERLGGLTERWLESINTKIKLSGVEVNKSLRPPSSSDLNRNIGTTLKEISCEDFWYYSEIDDEEMFLKGNIPLPDRECKMLAKVISPVTVALLKQGLLTSRDVEFILNYPVPNPPYGWDDVTDYLHRGALEVYRKHRPGRPVSRFREIERLVKHK